MAFGKLRKIWEKIKGGAKKAFGWIKENVLPIAKVAAPIIGGFVGGPEGALMGGKIVGGVENGIGTLFPSLNTKGFKPVGAGLQWKV
jgi:hypothetical protein